MKIEVEFEEVETLRAKCRSLGKEVAALEEKLKALDEPAIKKEVIDRSYSMFRAYMDRIAKDLGMSASHIGGESFGGLEHWLEGSPWNSDRLKVEVGATVTNEWRTMFIDLGVVPKKKDA